jgi:UTP--glucose-1-phosphate uridylyltransferase
MKELAVTKGMVGVDFTGKRYNMGSKIGVLQANVEVGLKHPEFGNEFREYLKELAKTL